MAETQVDRLQRVLSLFLTLRQSWEPLTRTQIEDRIPFYRDERGRRRFEDDKDQLGQAGIPIVKTHLPGDKGATAYTIDGDFFLPDLGLTDDEQLAFGLAARSIDLRDVTWIQLAGTKLGAWAPASVQPVAHLPTSVLLPTLADAIAARRRLTVTYNHTEPRHIDPYAIVLARGHWYVPSYCHRNAEVRAFRVDRIEPTSVVVGDAGGYEVPVGFDPWTVVPRDPRTMGDLPPVTAVLRVDPAFVPVVLADLDDVPDPLPTDDTGAVLVPVPVNHVGSFLSWVFGFGDRVEVVEPRELRQHLVDWLHDLVERDDAPDGQGSAGRPDGGER